MGQTPNHDDPRTPLSGIEGLARHVARVRAEEERVQQESNAAYLERMKAKAHWESERAILEFVRPRILDAADLVNATLSLSGMRLDEEAVEETFTYDDELEGYRPWVVAFRLKGRSCDDVIGVFVTTDELNITLFENWHSHDFSGLDGVLEADASVEVIADRLADIILWLLEKQENASGQPKRV